MTSGGGVSYTGGNRATYKRRKQHIRADLSGTPKVVVTQRRGTTAMRGLHKPSLQRHHSQQRPETMPDFDFRHAPKPARVRQDSDLIKPESIFRGSSPGVTTWHRALSTSPKVNIGGAGLSRFDDAARTSTNHTIKTAKPPLPAPLGASTTESAESLRLRLLKLDDWLETSTSKSQPASGGPGQPSLERWPPSPERASASLPTPAAMSARAHLVREGLAPSRHAGSSSISVTYQARRRRSSRAGTSDVLDRGEDELLENATLGDADGQPFQGDVEPSHATRRTMTPRAVASSDVAEAPSSPANTALSGWDTRSRSQSVWQTDATEQDPGKPSSDMPATPSQTTPTREIAHSDASPTFPASHSNRLFFSPPIKGFYARLTTAVLTLPSPRLDYAVAVDWTGPCSATANQRRELKDVYRFSRAQSGPLVIEGQPSDHLGLGSTGAGLSSSAPIATVEARLTAWRAANGCELDFDDWKWLEEDVLGLADWDEDEWEQLEWLLGLANDVHDDPRRNEESFASPGRIIPPPESSPPATQIVTISKLSALHPSSPSPSADGLDCHVDLDVQDADIDEVAMELDDQLSLR